MSATYTSAGDDTRVENDWTIMVFFAGEQDLSPSMTSQLKAIKDAGFQENTTVLIHYDPNRKGVGTVTFDINRKRKQEMPTSIGDGKDPFVRNLLEDVIPGAPKGATAADALKTFLGLGCRNYPAKHYMIILVGHGVIVGNDAFLPDNTPESAITLQQLGDILSSFRGCVSMNDGVVDLIGLHSCSMSAIEVAYQLKGTARYLLATEGVSFVGSWPYRQMIKKILYEIDEAKTNNTKVDVDRLIMKLQKLCLHNSTDFMFSGLSADLSLCSLDPERIGQLNDPMRTLTRALKAGLKDRRGVELITLAHLEAQSYYQESYTDLYDFCLCLEKKCREGGRVQDDMKEACEGVRARLKETNHPDGLVVRSDFFGPLYQYSHGLSVYFPWTEPVHDNPPLPGDDILLRYQEYAFTKELGEDSWLSFLKEYFNATMRKSRETEEEAYKVIKVAAKAESGVRIGAAGNGTLIGTAAVGVDALDRKISPELDDGGRKISPELTSGGCGCSVKNYPMAFIKSPRAFEDANQGRNGSQKKSSRGVVSKSAARS
jgi:hypothetical protein